MSWRDDLDNVYTDQDARIQDLGLEAIVMADAAHIADLVLWGRSAEADEYAQRPDVAARIRRWKANR